MSETIFDYITPNKRGRSLGPARPCQREECRRPFRTTLDRKKQVFCSITCANRDHAEKRWRERPRCQRPGCPKRFKRRRLSQTFCSRACYNAVIVPVVEDDTPDSAPVCCGEALHFATDFLGRTTQVCRVCGERPVRLYGTRIYDQRTRLEVELQERQKTAQAPVDPKYRDLGGGSAYRQKAYKGIAAHLKPEAA